MINCAPEPGTYYLQDSSESNAGGTKFITSTSGNCITSDEYDPTGLINPDTNGNKESIVMDTASLSLISERFTDAACSSVKRTTEKVYDFTMASGSYTSTLYTETLSAALNSAGNYDSTYTYETITNAQIMNATYTASSITCHVQSECDNLNANYAGITDQVGNPITACTSLVFTLGTSVDVTTCVEAQNTADASTGTPAVDNPDSTFFIYNDTANGKLYVSTDVAFFNALAFYQ